VNTKYGQFSEEQVDEYKVILHKKLFWLLLYKDPKTKKDYESVDFERYYSGLMGEINGFNELLSCPKQIVEIMSLLEAALIESRNDDFDYSKYRKYVLDAHALIDQIGKR
jgi:hypothetical protein